MAERTEVERWHYRSRAMVQWEQGLRKGAERQGQINCINENSPHTILRRQSGLLLSLAFSLDIHIGRIY